MRVQAMRSCIIELLQALFIKGFGDVARHALKLKNQPQEFAGVFRTEELAVGDDVVMAASAVPGTMEGFITWLNANGQDCEDVASFAANAHFKLVLETLRRHTLMLMNQPPEFAGVFALMKE
uniref:HECT domain-containing protein n=1 Tax=Globodera pallida TaxID=36090 RepID=A0A183CI26_GLOPA